MLLDFLKLWKPSIWSFKAFNYVYNISSCVKKKYTATRFRCQNFERKGYIDNQKVRVADEIKRDVWEYLVKSDWKMMLDLIMFIN